MTDNSLKNGFNQKQDFSQALVDGIDKNGDYDMENDPDRPENAINMSLIVEEIDINGHI